jgi:hypothetical protein
VKYKKLILLFLLCGVLGWSLGNYLSDKYPIDISDFLPQKDSSAIQM